MPKIIIPVKQITPNLFSNTFFLYAINSKEKYSIVIPKSIAYEVRACVRNTKNIKYDDITRIFQEISRKYIHHNTGMAKAI